MNIPPPDEGDSRPPPPPRYRAMQRVEGPVLNLVGLSCREFARLAVARLDRPLTVAERLRLGMHGAVCGVCARFASQFALLHELAREVETSPAGPKTSPDAEAAVARINSAVRTALRFPDQGLGS